MLDITKPPFFSATEFHPLILIDAPNVVQLEKLGLMLSQEYLCTRVQTSYLQTNWLTLSVLNFPPVIQS
jgi:hypothetical protein